MSRFLITAVMVAAKFIDDFRLSNRDFAKIGGISNAEMNILELELLKTLDFNLSVNRLLFENYAEGILGAPSPGELN